MTVFFWIAVACAVGYLRLTARPDGVLRSVVKTGAVAGLAVAAIGGPGMLVVALAFCALGDWLLSRDGDAAFMAGIGAFAVGHLAYIALFLLHPLADGGRILGTPQIWIAAGFVVLGLVMAWQLGARAGALRGAVLGYIPIILGMGVAALALPGPGWVLLAACAFVASDLVLASEKFIWAEERAWAPYVIWVLYWGAQAGFYLSF